MQKTTYLFLLLFTFIISCGNKTKPKEEGVKMPDFTKTYEGFIDSKYEIIMTLTKKSGELNGTYTYKTHGVAMKLSGTIEENGNFSLDEYNPTGKVTGMFKGKLESTNITGNWSKADGTHAMPFSLAETNNLESSYTKADHTETEEWMDDWTGKYENDGNSLKIKGPDKNGAVNFEFLQVGETCEGSGLTGIAYLTKSWLANYSEEKGNCQISFTYNSDQIEIMETECSDYHGATCGSFDGIYKRKK
jgi:hypothetical protein